MNTKPRTPHDRAADDRPVRLGPARQLTRSSFNGSHSELAADRQYDLGG